MRVFGARGCAILYHLFRSRQDRRAVLIPANVCPQVPLTLRQAGRALQCVDIDPETLAIDTAQCRRLLDAAPDGIGAIIHVRPYGADAGSGAFFAELKRSRPDLLLVDDACLAPPDVEGLTVSPHADATLFSTGSRKYADLGFGAFAHLASPMRYEPQAPGPFDAAQCAALEARLSRRIEGAFEQADAAAWLDTGPLPGSDEDYVREVIAASARVAAHKARINAIYSSSIPLELQLPARFQQWRFNVRVPQADAFCIALQREGLFAGRHYRALGPLVDGRYPQAEALAADIVNLFNDLHVDEAAAHAIAALLRGFLAGRRTNPSV